MITKFSAVPNVTLLETVVIAGELGVTVGVIQNRSFRKLKPTHKKYFGPVKVVYAKGIRGLTNFLDPLMQQKSEHVVLINDSVSAFHEFGIPIETDFGVADLRKLLESSLDPIEVGVSKSKDLSEEIFEKYNKDSILKTLQSAFYRIKDPVERSTLQGHVFAYLGNVTKVVPVSYIRSLNNLMRAPQVANFKKAIAASRKVSVDEAASMFNVDRFELQYVRVRCGLSSNERIK